MTATKKKSGKPNAISVVVRVRPLDVNPQGHLLSQNNNNSAINNGNAPPPLDPAHTNVLMLTTDKAGFSPVVTVLTQQQARDSHNNVKLVKRGDNTTTTTTTVASSSSPQLSLPSFSGGMGAGGSKGRQWPTFAYDSCFGPMACYEEYRTYFPLTSNIVAASSSPAPPRGGGGGGPGGVDDIDDNDEDDDDTTTTNGGVASQQQPLPLSTSSPESNEQEDVYNRVGIPALRTLFKGYNSSVIAYGQTGSGKTYSMFGPADLEKSMGGGGGNNNVGNNSSIHNHTIPPQESSTSSTNNIPEVFNHPERGLIIRIAEALFQSLLQKQDEAVHHTNGEGFFNFEVTCSFYQIYREKAWELLPETTTSATSQNPTGSDTTGGGGVGKSSSTRKKGGAQTTAQAGWSSSVGLGGGGGVSELAQEMLAAVGVKPLRLRSTDATGAFLEGLRKVPVKTPAELVALLQQGMSNRQVAATHLNMHSSRSHALCSINLKCRTNIGFAEVESPTTTSPFSSQHHHAPKVSKTELRTCNCTLHLVDLAGSERVGMLIGGDAEQYSKVLGGGGANNNNDASSIHHQKHHADAKNLMKSDAQRFKEITDRRMLEASDINKSLSALGKVIHALATAQEQQHQPTTSTTTTPSSKKTGTAAAAPRAKSSLKKGGGVTSSYSRVSTGTSSKTSPQGSRTTSPRALQQQITSSSSVPHIPYRDSILTHLLKDCFGGNSSTFMLATISPMMRDAEETLSTLRFSSKARSIENVPKNTAKKMKLWSESTAAASSAPGTARGSKKKKKRRNNNNGDSDDDSEDDEEYEEGERPNTSRSTTSQSLTPRRRELRDHKARLLALENAELQENLKMFKQEIQVLRDEISRLAREVEEGGSSRSRAASLALGASGGSTSMLIMGGGGGGSNNMGFSNNNSTNYSQQQQQMAISGSSSSHQPPYHKPPPLLAQEKVFNHSRTDYMAASSSGAGGGGGQTTSTTNGNSSMYKVSAPDSFLSSSSASPHHNHHPSSSRHSPLHHQQPDELVVGEDIDDIDGGDGFEGSPSPPPTSSRQHLNESSNTFEKRPADEYEVMRAMADKLETTEVYLKQLEAENAQFRRTVQQQESQRLQESVKPSSSHQQQHIPQQHRTTSTTTTPTSTAVPSSSSSSVPQRSANTCTTSSSTTIAPPKVRVLVKDPEMCEGEAGGDEEEDSLPPTNSVTTPIGMTSPPPPPLSSSMGSSSNQYKPTTISTSTPATTTTTTTTATSSSYPDVWLSRHSPASTPRGHSSNSQGGGTKMMAVDLGSPIVGRDESGGGGSRYQYNPTTPPPTTTSSDRSVHHQLMNNTLPPNHHINNNNNNNPTGLVQSRPQSPSVRRGATPTRQTRFNDDDGYNRHSTTTTNNNEEEEVSLHRLHLDTPHPAAKPHGARYATIGNPRLLRNDDDYENSIKELENRHHENDIKSGNSDDDDSLLHLRGTINDLNLQLLTQSPSSVDRRGEGGSGIEEKRKRVSMVDVPLDQLVRQHHATALDAARQRRSTSPQQHPSSTTSSDLPINNQRYMQASTPPPPRHEGSSSSATITSPPSQLRPSGSTAIFTVASPPSSSTQPPPATTTGRRRRHDGDSSDSSSSDDDDNKPSTSGNALITSLLAKVSIDNVRTAALAVGMKPSKIEQLLAQHRDNSSNGGSDGGEVVNNNTQHTTAPATGANRAPETRVNIDEATTTSRLLTPAVASSSARGPTSSPEPRLPSSGGTARSAFTSTTAVRPGGVVPAGRNPQLIVAAASATSTPTSAGRRGTVSPSSRAGPVAAATPSSSSRQPTKVVPKRRGLSPSQLPLQRLPVTTSTSRQPPPPPPPSSQSSRSTPISNNYKNVGSGVGVGSIASTPTIATTTTTPTTTPVTATAAPVITVRRQGGGGVSNRVMSPQPGKRIIN